MLLSSLTLILLLVAISQADPICSSKLDLVLSLDGSSSISAPDFKLMIDFCTRLTQTFNFSATGVRLGAVQFSSVLQQEFAMTQNKAEALAAVAKIKKLVKSGTDIAGGINLAYKVLQAAPARSECTQTILLITDGRQSVAGDPLNAANMVKSKNVQLFIVGVGAKINPTVLQQMASEPKNTHYFPINNFAGLAEILTAIATHACPSYNCDAIKPVNGPAAGGTLVTITGSNLQIKNPQCKFGDKIVQGKATGANTIQCVSPPGISGSSVPLMISVDGGATWLNQNCQFSYSIYKPDLCAQWSQNCSYCISHPLCGWCSVNVTHDDGTVGVQCAGFNKTGGEQPFTCIGTFNTQACTKGYLCDLQTATCKLTLPGNGVEKQTCQNNCGNGYVYQCNKTSNTCELCENGTPGCVSTIECFNDCQIPFAPTPDQPGINGTPKELVGTVWRGLQINRNYTGGEQQLKFDSTQAKLWVVRSKTLSVFKTSYSGEVLWLTAQDGSVYKARYITNYVGEVVAVTVAVGAKGGDAPSTFDAAMVNAQQQAHIFGRCLNSATCNFHWDGPAKKREAQVDDYCMNFTSCTPCITQDRCGWCSNNVIYNDGTVGRNCAGFNKDGGKKPFVCSGTFSSDMCTTEPTTYECEPRSKQCIQSQPGAGTDKKSCELFCSRPLPPADNVTPVALQGTWRGLQIHRGYETDEFTAVFGQTNAVISKNGVSLIAGDTQSVEDQIWINTAKGKIMGKWQVAYGPETALIGLAFGPIGGPLPFDFGEAMTQSGYSEFWFMSCLFGKQDAGVCLFDH